MITRTLLTILLITLFTSTIATAQIYVKHDANGANNGLSWTDAYADLQEAISAAVEGEEIWVAAGTYKPAGSGGEQTAVFLIDKNLKLLGGFAGTETNAGQRDPIAYPTILSGDLNGDDIEGDFLANRSDNIRTIIRIGTAVTNNTILEGFILRSGHANAAGTQEAFNGGAMYCQGAPIIRHCIFENNHAKANGGALYMEGIGASGTRIEDCVFSNNQSYDSSSSIGRGGAIYVSDVREAGVFITNTVITNNTAEFTAGLSLYNSKANLDGVVIADNSALMHGGGLWFFSNNVDHLTLSLTNCTLDGNRSTFGGAFYFLVTGEHCNLNMTNTSFTGNEALPLMQGWDQAGGAAFLQVLENGKSAEIIIDGCSFTDNFTTGNGGALNVKLEAAQMNFQLRNSVFTGNSADLSGSAYIRGSNYGAGNVLVDNCIFEYNEAKRAAGLSVGNKAVAGLFDYAINNCRFTGNTAMNFGGALECMSESEANFFSHNCTFESNTAGIRGGALLLSTTHSGFQVSMRNSVFTGNHSPYGAALAAFPPDSGGNMTGEAQALLDNCLFSENSGEKATIAVHEMGMVKLLNCNVVENQSGALLLDDNGSLSMQNTIFYNPGYTEFRDPAASASFTSLGGNLVADNSLNDWLTEQDLADSDPLFSGPGDYQLSSQSPCIDAGINAGVTTQLDLAGNTRIQGGQVDIGVFESAITDTTDPLMDKLELEFFPNPATDHVYIQVPRHTGDLLSASLFNAQGKLMGRQILSGGQPFMLQGLLPGIYIIQLEHKRKVYTGKFIVE